MSFALFYTVENNCGYHLFESDSEEEEEEVVEKKEEEEPPKKKTAFQVRARKPTDKIYIYIFKDYRCFMKSLMFLHHQLSRVSVSLTSQLAYDAWITSSKTALKDLKKEKKKRKKEEKKRAKRELQRQQGEFI